MVQFAVVREAKLLNTKKMFWFTKAIKKKSLIWICLPDYETTNAEYHAITMLHCHTQVLTMGPASAVEENC